MLTNEKLRRMRLAKLPTPTRPRPPRPKGGSRFLKGPVPWPWLCRAARLPGKAGMIGVALWFWAGLTRRRTVKLSYLDLAFMGIGRIAVRRGLAAMEDVGLVTVERKTGAAPVVTLCDIPES